MIALLPILLISLLIYWRAQEAVSMLRVGESGDIELQFRQGQIATMQLLPSSVVTAHFIVLHLANAERRVNLVVWPDSAPAEVLRQWRIYLLWSKAGAERVDNPPI